VRDQLEILGGMMVGFDSSKYFTGLPAERLKCLNEGAEFLQQTKEMEQRFMSNALRMSKAFNLCNSAKDFTKHELDLIHYYKALRSVLFKLTKGDAPDTDTMNAHVAQMMEAAIQSEGVEEVFSTDTTMNQEAIDLFSDEYLELIKRMKLQNTKINNIALAATSVWRYTGQNVILFLGAMMSVDSVLYEAAALDGCNRWQQFRYVILPSIKSIIVLNIILCVSGCLSAFEPPYVITNGSFGTATYFVQMNSVAHETQKVGLASAMAIVLLALIILCTVAQRLFFKYVFNNGTEDESKAAVRAKKKAARAAGKTKGGVMA
jgi:hypothetical protein